MSHNPNRQQQMAIKLQRNLSQVFSSVDAVSVSFASNGSDVVVKVDGGSEAKRALVKFKEEEIGIYPHPALPQHFIAMLVAPTVDAGFLCEVVSRVHELHCAIEMSETDGTVPVLDQDDVAGVFLAAHSSVKRFIRASVDTINIGQ